MEARFLAPLCRNQRPRDTRRRRPTASGLPQRGQFERLECRQLLALTPHATAYVDGAEPSATTLAALPALPADTSKWFPITLSANDVETSFTDASDLLVLDQLNVPVADMIDARGFITTTADGHFVTAKTGEPVRFWGTNLTFDANFPPSPDHPPRAGEAGDIHSADTLAARFAKLGFNAVRLHLMDFIWTLWSRPDLNTQVIDPIKLARLDYLLYQFKQHGIYVDLNLHAGRDFVNGDGVTDASKFADSRIEFNKGTTLYDPVMIELQRKYARQLLTHVNPYTKLAYRDDPVIFTTETSNEDSFLLSFVQDGLNYDPQDPKSLPEFYSRELDGWSDVSGTGPLANRLLNANFDQGLSSWFTSKSGSAAATFGVDATGHDGAPALKINVTQTDGVDWHVQVGQGDLALLAGTKYRLSFAARADRAVNVTGLVMRNETPYDAVGWVDTVGLTTQWVTHTIEFTAPETILGPARVSFDVGHAPATLWFDNFRLQELSASQGWLGWLEDKYGSTEAIAAAWAPATTVPETEMLSNGGLESGITGWQHQVSGGAQASFTADSTIAASGNRSLRVTVTQVDGTPWNAQFWQTPLAVTAGQSYTLSFDARADRDTSINYNVMQSHAPWESVGLNGASELTSAWKHFEYVFTATSSEPNARVGIDVGQELHTVWFDNLSLKPFNIRGLKPDESLQANHIARLRRAEVAAYTPQRLHDTIEFYEQTEARFYTGMHDFVKNDLHSQSLNTGTASYIDSLVDIKNMAKLDFVDNHRYWDHPYWPNVPAWSPTGWFIRNESWLNHPFDLLFDLSSTAVSGKPFTVTEFNEPFPNRYAVEGPLLMASFANLQNWDAVFMFAYAGDFKNYTADHVTGYFDMAGNPLMTAMMPVASRLFLQHQNAALPTRHELSYTSSETYDSVTYGWGGSGATYLKEARGVSAAAAFETQLRIKQFAAPAASMFSLPADAGPIYRSGTEELTWDTSSANRARYLLNAPAFQGAVGFLNGNNVSLRDWQISVPSDTADFGAITLQSIDGQEIAAAQSLLLGVFTRVENTNMQWNAEQTTIDDRWGQAPARVEPLRFTATFSLPDAKGWEVWALNAQGVPQQQLTTTTLSAQQFAVTINTAATPSLWFAIRRAAGLPGDFDANGQLDAADLQLFCQALRQGKFDNRYDLTRDGRLDDSDRDHLIRVIFHTDYGDANLDGVFDSLDLISIFQMGQYEDTVIANSVWESGDWTCDAEFNTDDLILAFQTGQYLS